MAIKWLLMKQSEPVKGFLGHIKVVIVMSFSDMIHHVPNLTAFRKAYFFY